MNKCFIFGLIAAFALCGSAFGTWTEAGNQSINVVLDIAQETWIQYQDDGYGQATHPQPDIVFGNGIGAHPADPWRPEGLIGIYDYDSTKAPTDAYATGWYESTDGATIYLKSNVDISGSIIPSGALKNDTDDELPSWFTVAVNGYDEDTSTKVAFNLGNSGSGDKKVSDGNPPGAGGPGGYGGTGKDSGKEVSGPVTLGFGKEDFHPFQDAFKMMATTYSLDMDAPVGPGTMKFLARVKRSGILDPAGKYVATIVVDFWP